MPEEKKTEQGVGISEGEYALFWEWWYAKGYGANWARPPDNNSALSQSPHYQQFIKDTSFKGDVSKIGLASYGAQIYGEAVEAIKGATDKSKPFQVWYSVIQQMRQIEKGKLGVSSLPNYKTYVTTWREAQESDIKTKGKLLTGGYISHEGNVYKDYGGIPVLANEAYQEYLDIAAQGKESTKIARERFEWEKKRWGMETAYAVTQAANERERERQKEASAVAIAQAKAQNLPGERKALELQERQIAWQEAGLRQASQLSQLTQPKDWITRWQVARGLRYYPQESPKWYTAQYNINQAREQTNLAAQQLQSGVISPQQYETSVQGYFGAVSEGAPWIAQQQQAVSESRPAIGHGVASPVFPASAPPAPEWLPAFAPGQKAGRTITEENIPTPSPQLWARTPWSEQQGLAGYTEWAGGRPLEDILDEMRMMQTGTPRRQGWLPTRQRI